jgi:hypothetical protein
VVAGVTLSAQAQRALFMRRHLRYVVFDALQFIQHLPRGSEQSFTSLSRQHPFVHAQEQLRSQPVFDVA